MLFWIWLRPRYKIPDSFTIAPVLAPTLIVCRRNRGDPSSQGALQVLQKHSRFGLVWSRTRTNRSPSRPQMYSVQQ